MYQSDRDVNCRARVVDEITLTLQFRGGRSVLVVGRATINLMRLRQFARRLTNARRCQAITHGHLAIRPSAHTVEITLIRRHSIRPRVLINLTRVNGLSDGINESTIERINYYVISCNGLEGLCLRYHYKSTNAEIMVLDCLLTLMQAEYLATANGGSESRFVEDIRCISDRDIILTLLYRDVTSENNNLQTALDTTLLVCNDLGARQCQNSRVIRHHTGLVNCGCHRVTYQRDQPHFQNNDYGHTQGGDSDVRQRVLLRVVNAIFSDNCLDPLINLRVTLPGHGLHVMPRRTILVALTIIQGSAFVA